MNLISINRCETIGELKNILEVLYNSLSKGNALIIQRKEEEYEVKLVGEKERE